MQWLTLFQKEIQENWYNKKWIWVPLVIILITIMDPISYYYLPEIINLAGGVPEGTVIDIPTLAPEEVMMMSLEQLSMFGVLLLAFISMGTIAGEKNSGLTEVILAKPVRYFNYVTAKWTNLLLLVWAALAVSMLLSWYYTNLLFGELSFIVLLQIIFFYGLWFTFVITVSIFYNTLFKTPGLVAACTIMTIVFMSLINMVFGHKLTWFPNQLSLHIHELVVTNTLSKELVGTSIIIAIITILVLLASIYVFKQKEIV